MINKAWVRLKFFSVLCLILFIFGSTIIKGQTCVRLRIFSGGNVSFSFNSLNKYINGITYTDFSKLSVFIKPCDVNADLVSEPIKTWNLYVKASNAVFLCDEVATQNLDLPILKLVATTTLADGTPQDITLTDSFQLLIKGPDVSSGPFSSNIQGEVTISYFCGTTIPYVATSVYGEKPGYYYVDLEFNLEAIY